MIIGYEPVSREDEISGMSPIEIRMYDLAWEHNSDGRGFAGLVDLWYKQISGAISLENVQRVWYRLNRYCYFSTAAYWNIAIQGNQNDYIPGSF